VLDSELLRFFANRFYGYGNPKAANWFISMEEAGGSTEDEVAARLSAWRQLGCQETCDVAEFHRCAKIGTEFFAENPPLQPTWYRMIRILLASEGQAPDVESARIYQRDQVGRANKTTLLSPLLPLPAPSIGAWPYGAWSDIVEFRDRATYSEYIIQQRIDYLSTRLTACRPRIVVFLGAAYRPHAERIIGTSLTEQEEGFWAATRGSTRIALCKHPNTRGLTNDYFDSVGRWLSRH
jgi:hypothetical protein